MNQPHVHLDFETRSGIDLTKVGADNYADHETTDILCAGYSIGDGDVGMWKLGQPLPFELVEAIDDDSIVFAHNAPFELALWNRCGVKKYGWPELPTKQVRCTSVMAYAMGLPGSLEKAAAAAGIEHQKDLKGSRVMMKMCKPKKIEADGSITWWEDSEDFAKLYAYCEQDVKVERELSQRLLQLSPSEQNLWILDQKINQRGILVDIDAARVALDLVDFETSRLDEEMKVVTGGHVNACSAVAQLTKWIEAQNVELDGVAKADILELLSRDGLPPVISQALLLRQEAAKSSTRKLQAMVERASPSDNRIRSIFQFHGAGTGRWAGRGIQPQNFPRPNISSESIEEVFGLLHGQAT